MNECINVIIMFLRISVRRRRRRSEREDSTAEIRKGKVRHINDKMEKSKTKM